MYAYGLISFAPSSRDMSDVIVRTIGSSIYGKGEVSEVVDIFIERAFISNSLGTEYELHHEWLK